MQTRRPWTAAVGWLLILAAGCAPTGAETARVRSVIDGDTLVVDDGSGRKRTVRLIGVDTPERRHPARPPEFMAHEATAFAARRVEGRRVRLEADPETEDRDKYGRLLRYVYLPEGELLNAELIRRGYGYAYTRFRFSRKQAFVELEQRAREEGLGVWSQGGLAEIRWIDEEGSGPFAVYPMTNRHWAIAYGDHVKTHVPANQLVRQLNRLLARIAEHQGVRLRRALQAEGYVTRPAHRD